MRKNKAKIKIITSAYLYFCPHSPPNDKFLRKSCTFIATTRENPTLVKTPFIKKSKLLTSFYDF